METTKVKYLKEAMLAVFFGLLVSSFSQSCSTTKASVTKYLTPVKLRSNVSGLGSYIKPLEPLTVARQALPPNSALKPIESTEKIADTTNYNKMILANQQLSLSNERKILEMLFQKEKENKKLKHEKEDLSKKVVISKEEKEDAIGLRAIWDMGRWVLTALFGVILLLMLQNYLLVLWISRRLKPN